MTKLITLISYSLNAMLGAAILANLALAGPVASKGEITLTVVDLTPVQESQMLHFTSAEPLPDYKEQARAWRAIQTEPAAGEP